MITWGELADQMAIEADRPDIDLASYDVVFDDGAFTHSIIRYRFDHDKCLIILE